MPKDALPRYDYEDDLVQAVRTDGKTRVRVYRLRDTVVVLGSGSRPELELNLDACREDRVPILRRRGGGCAVVLDPGNVIVTVTAAGLPFGHHDLEVFGFFGKGGGLRRESPRKEPGAPSRGESPTPGRGPEAARAVDGAGGGFPARPQGESGGRRACFRRLRGVRRRRSRGARRLAFGRIWTLCGEKTGRESPLRNRACAKGVFCGSSAN